MDDDDDDNDEDDASTMFRNVLPFNWLRVKFKKTLPNSPATAPDPAPSMVPHVIPATNTSPAYSAPDFDTLGWLV